jgi:dTDP-glucose pyrophosphorylase
LVKEVEKPRQYGVAVVRNEVIVRLVEKPKEPPSNIAILSFYKFSRNFFKYLERVMSGVETRPIYYGDVYFDVGTPQTYLKALKWIIDVARKKRWSSLTPPSPEAAS